MAENKKEFTILIADDEKMNVDILGGILSPMYNILISRTGRRAIELAEKHKPDLILLDVLMPEMSGFEVIVELKKTDLTNKIPIIFITGLTGAEDEERGFFLGAVDYITKPFHKAIVKARVNTHIKIVDHMRTIEKIGLMDPLTKISNRRGFENRLTAEWGRAIRDQTPISLLLMDIDKFKNYNDTYGHGQGDTALKTFAELAAAQAKRSGDLAARWGGEEFVVLLPNTNINSALEIAERLRQSVEAAVILTEDGDITKMTVSIGANTVTPQIDSPTTTEFINKADQALYTAKSTGRNRVERFADV